MTKTKLFLNIVIVKKQKYKLKRKTNKNRSLKSLCNKTKPKKNVQNCTRNRQTVLFWNLKNTHKLYGSLLWFHKTLLEETCIISTLSSLGDSFVPNCRALSKNLLHVCWVLHPVELTESWNKKIFILVCKCAQPCSLHTLSPLKNTLLNALSKKPHSLKF